MPSFNETLSGRHMLRFSAFLASVVFVGAAYAQSDWTRYRLHVPDAAAVQRVCDSTLTLYSEDVVIGETDVAVGPGQLPELLRLKIPYSFVSKLEPIDRYKDENLGEGDPPDYKTNYLRYNQIIQQYEIWRQRYPTLITRQQVGSSQEGRPIWAYRLHYPNLVLTPKVVLLQGGIHAREWISPPVVMYIFESLLTRSQVSAADWWLLANIDLRVIPNINPDGYEYTWNSNRLWRKNRRNNGGGAYGVDLNRNYSKAWGGAGSSGNPSSETYRGPSAFSEPELTGVRDYALSLTNHAGFIDYHSYAQKILYPWSYTTNPAPHQSLFQSLGDTYRNEVLASGGVSYQVGQGAVILYVASGSSKDYYYDQYTIPAYTIELRDTGQYGFELPASQILPTARENWAGFRAWLYRLVN